MIAFSQLEVGDRVIRTPHPFDEEDSGNWTEVPPGTPGAIYDINKGRQVIYVLWDPVGGVSKDESYSDTTFNRVTKLACIQKVVKNPPPCHPADSLIQELFHA